jgi:hypothetical protein
VKEEPMYVKPEVEETEETDDSAPIEFYAIGCFLAAGCMYFGWDQIESQGRRYRLARWIFVSLGRVPTTLIFAGIGVLFAVIAVKEILQERREQAS